MSAELYHNRVLELAAETANVGRLENAGASVEKVSRICGSKVRVDLSLDADCQHVTAIAVDPKACALGQAATAILSAHAVGAHVDEIIAARDGLRAMLKDGGPPPGGRFYELRHLAGVADYPPRHASTLLAFEAAAEAIGQICAERALTT